MSAIEAHDERLFEKSGDGVIIIDEVCRLRRALCGDGAGNTPGTSLNNSTLGQPSTSGIVSSLSEARDLEMMGRRGLSK